MKSQKNHKQFLKTILKKSDPKMKIKNFHRSSHRSPIVRLILKRFKALDKIPHLK